LKGELLKLKKAAA
jgi:hypothetical protein